MHGLAVRADRGELDAAVLVLDPVRLLHGHAAALNRLPVRLRRARDGERDVLHPVAVRVTEARHLAVRAQAARDDEADVTLLEHV